MGVERQANVIFDPSQPSPMLYELQQFLCKLGLTSGPCVLPDGEAAGAVNDRTQDTQVTFRPTSTSKESVQLQNAKAELTPAVGNSVR